MADIQVAMRAADFIDTIGVNTHLAWKGSGLPYSHQDKIVAAIDYLGVNYIRDGVPHAGYTLDQYVELAERGVQFNLLVTSDAFNETGDYAHDLDNAERLVRAAPGSVVSIEGLNEVNTWPVTYNGQSTAANLALGRDVQKLLYDQVHAHAGLGGIEVLNLTLGGLRERDVGPLGNMSAFADYGTFHVYYGNGDQPAVTLAAGVSAAKAMAPDDPVQITESGYYNAIHDMSWLGGGVSEAVQAKLTLNLLMDAASMGVARTFLYELMDNGLRPTSSLEGSFGLFRGDGSPKPVADAIHNLTTLLHDDGSNAESFATNPLDISISGMPSSGKSMLLQSSDGDHQLVLWAEPVIWSMSSLSEVWAPSQSVTISLGEVADSIRVYDPLRGTGAIEQASNSDRITVELSDHPIIIDISDDGGRVVSDAPAAPAAPETGGSAGSVIGAGSHALVLEISQDFYQENARYTVSVDGVQQGGTLTANAVAGRDAPDIVTIKGDWSEGRHTVTVDFLNDAYAGTPETDRNLHVEGISYDGVDLADGSATLLSAGHKHFALPATADWAM
ncbi:carbohydrate-binding domain-containing protein [Siccirubricoccus phaeus]|uniref:carbohydrate-binding domain-containing protein n=1 Tax=Siccirubricoccus phaeus TaxID=2595053 RepID=UPI0011F35159|nr:carbohydrate-binding domain-containing protein [Siccirubricoccus phaeus]